MAEIANEILDEYVKEDFDAIYLIYNEFKSAIQQQVTVERLVPVSTEVPEGVVGIRKQSEEDRYGSNYVFEPSQEVILNEIVPQAFSDAAVPRGFGVRCE